ncbi:MAG TPA: FAD-dependent monooxygenase, partial [Allocoleopsis sp.]
ASPQFEFIQGIAVQDVLWQGQRVAGVKLNDGRELHGDITIATDGRNSIVRQRANLVMQHFSRNFDILWFQLPDHPRFEHENVFYSILQDRHAFGVFRSSEGNLQLGWALREPDAIDWQQINWAERLAANAPDWLADHCRTHADSLDRPVLLSVVVGRCPQWWVPGLLLLGDAAHPMSPIRAQGINMALRDGIVTANYLVPRLQQSAMPEAIDAVLPQIQAEREPEIIRAQQLQRAEAAQADKLEQSAFLRWGASQFAAVIRQPVRQSWLHRQRQLRQGVTTVQLKV